MTKLKTLDYYSDRALIAEVRRRGYIVHEDKFGWERPCQFSRRHGRNPNYLANRMKRTPAPPPFENEKGKTGRTIRLRSNPQLESWMQR